MGIQCLQIVVGFLRSKTESRLVGLSFPRQKVELWEGTYLVRRVCRSLREGGKIPVPRPEHGINRTLETWVPSN